jgi:hypothetical protein
LCERIRHVIGGGKSLLPHPSGVAAASVVVASAYLWELCREFNRVRMIPFHPHLPRSVSQHPVQLLHHPVDRVVHVDGAVGGDKIGAGDLNAAAGGKDPLMFGVLNLQFHADSIDARLVAEKLVRLFGDVELQGFAEVEVISREDQFLIIHDFGG